MIKHFLKIAFRNILQKKIFSLINLLSLSIGLACFFLIIIYVVNEFSFDRFHKNSQNIFRVYEWTEGLKGSTPGGDAMLYMPLGSAMKRDLPEIKDFSRYMRSYDKYFVKSGDKTVRLPLTYVDPQFLDLFSFNIVTGSSEKALLYPNNIVLTQKYSKLLFGDNNPIGEIIEIKIGEKFEPFIVQAVVQDPPANSSLKFEILASFAYFENTPDGRGARNNWQYSGFQNFVLLQPGTNPANVQSKLIDFRKKYFPDETAQLLKDSLWNGKGQPPISFRLEPLIDIHDDARIKSGGDESIDTNSIWILSSITIGLLLIGCINFTTLAIGRSSGRGKEIGVRKIIGGNRKLIMIQFLFESFMLSCISGLIAIVIAFLLLPYFNQLAEKELSFSLKQYPSIILLFSGIIVLSGILAGIYSSFILSRIKITTVLKNKIRLSGSNFFTKSLITFQYIISIGLIISTIVIFQQLNYIKHKDLGFNKANVIVVNAEGTNTNKTFTLFRQQISRNRNILDISSLNTKFGDGYSSSGFEYNGVHKQAINFFAGTNFLNVMGLHLIKGRDFSSSFTEDTVNSAIVNEAFVKDLNLSNNSVIGLKLAGYSADPKKDPVIIGVVKNFNLLPVKQEILPTIFRQKSVESPTFFYVRISPKNTTETINVLQKTWVSLEPNIPFEYSFLDRDIDAMYRWENRLSNIILWASGISIFLASLGLCGLALLAAANRTKELVIRKIFGGSYLSIIYLLSKDFLKLVIVALLIASAISGYFLHRWLEDYAYRVKLDFAVFGFTAAFVIFMTFIIILITVLNAISIKPVNALRNE